MNAPRAATAAAAAWCLVVLAALLPAAAAADPASFTNPPSELSAFAIPGTLRWDPVQGAQAYEVRVYSDATYLSGTLVLASGTQTTTSFRVTGLTQDATYHVRLWTRFPDGWQATQTTLSTASLTSVARLSNPSDELQAFSVTGTFRWDPAALADAYELRIYDGNDLGALVFASGTTSATSARVLLNANQAYTVRLWSRSSGLWQVAQYSIQTSSQLTVARLANPEAEIDAFAPSGVFRWDAVALADAYEVRLYAGTVCGSTPPALASGTLHTVSFRPFSPIAPGVYCARLWTRSAGVWRDVEYRLTVAATPLLARPINDEVELNEFSPNGTIRWYSVTNAEAYELRVYNQPGYAIGALVYASGRTTELSSPIPGLTAGAAYYARLWTLVGGVWRYVEFEIQTSSVDTLARPTTPQSTLDSMPRNGSLTWYPISGAAAYELRIYTDPTFDSTSLIAASGATAATTIPVTGLTPGTTYFARLWTSVNGVWGSVDFQFSTEPNHPPVAPATYTILAAAGAPFSEGQPATDPDGDAIHYTVEGNPSWLTVDSASGLLSGTADGGAAGTYVVTVTATDSYGATASYDWSVVIVGPSPAANLVATLSDDDVREPQVARVNQTTALIAYTDDQSQSVRAFLVSGAITTSILTIASARNPQWVEIPSGGATLVYTKTSQSGCTGTPPCTAMRQINSDGSLEGDEVIFGGTREWASLSVAGNAVALVGHASGDQIDVAQVSGAASAGPTLSEAAVPARATGLVASRVLDDPSNGPLLFAATVSTDIVLQTYALNCSSSICPTLLSTSHHSSAILPTIADITHISDLSVWSGGGALAISTKRYSRWNIVLLPFQIDSTGEALFGTPIPLTDTRADSISQLEYRSASLSPLEPGIVVVAMYGEDPAGQQQLQTVRVDVSTGLSTTLAAVSGPSRNTPFVALGTEFPFGIPLVYARGPVAARMTDAGQTWVAAAWQNPASQRNELRLFEFDAYSASDVPTTLQSAASTLEVAQSNTTPSSSMKIAPRPMRIASPRTGAVDQDPTQAATSLTQTARQWPLADASQVRSPAAMGVGRMSATHAAVVFPQNISGTPAKAAGSAVGRISATDHCDRIVLGSGTVVTVKAETVELDRSLPATEFSVRLETGGILAARWSLGQGIAFDIGGDAPLATPRAGVLLCGATLYAWMDGYASEVGSLGPSGSWYWRKPLTAESWSLRVSRAACGPDDALQLSAMGFDPSEESQPLRDLDATLTRFGDALTTVRPAPTPSAARSTADLICSVR